MNKKVTLDETGKVWGDIVTSLLSTSTHIIALRGAGSFNGISVTEANRILKEILFPRIERYLEDGVVSFIFDGDNDDPKYPDIGHIAGRIRDHYSDRVEFYAVQSLSWYRYREELPNIRPLHSANKNEYETVLFPEKTFEGEHSHFSQHTRLTKSDKYEQWYIGACGKIASSQLADFSEKSNGSPGPHKVLVVKSPVSIEQEKKIQLRIDQDPDSERGQRLKASLVQRAENPFGLLHTADGEFISSPDFSKLKIEAI